MESEGIESARGVMERALRVINFVNENDRLNLWTSYLNLELNFGQEEKLISTFKKGCNSCNPKHLHLKLIDIYRKADKYDLMVELAKVFYFQYTYISQWLININKVVNAGKNYYSV